MTRSLERTEGIGSSDAEVLDDIKIYGWHFVQAFATENEQGPNWAFSIGLFHSFGHPEIIVFRLSLENCMGVVNEIGRQVRAGNQYQIGREYSDILGG